MASDAAGNVRKCAAPALPRSVCHGPAKETPSLRGPIRSQGQEKERKSKKGFPISSSAKPFFGFPACLGSQADNARFGDGGLAGF